jgi:hypothetical protein
MKECNQIKSCKFINEYKKNNDLRVVVRGFIGKYCQSEEKSDQCVRKKMAQMLGDWNKVPINMMPNGLSLPGTDSSNWLNVIDKCLKWILYNNDSYQEDSFSR